MEKTRAGSRPRLDWRLAALVAGALAVSYAAESVRRERLARARRLGVSVIALSHPERLLRKLRSAGL